MDEDEQSLKKVIKLSLESEQKRNDDLRSDAEAAERPEIYFSQTPQTVIHTSSPSFSVPSTNIVQPDVTAKTSKNDDNAQIPKPSTSPTITTSPATTLQEFQNQSQR